MHPDDPSTGDLAPFVAGPPGDAAAVLRVAASAADHWGLPRPEHMRTGMNVLFTVGDDVVLRVGRVTAAPGAALDLADVLVGHGIAVPTPALRDAYQAEGLTVMAHRRLRSTGSIDWTEVGRMVERLHRIEPGEFPDAYPRPWCGSFPWWRLTELVDELADDIDPAALAAMRRTLDEHGDWQERCDEVTVCHGDVHPGNVVQTDAGPVLLDWDLLCTGPTAWDHAPLVPWTERWGGEPGVYEAFATGYGRSFAHDRLTVSLSTLRLLAATLMRCRAGRTDPKARVEAERRLRWWRGDPDAPAWRPA